ncbi:hypothetical protein HJG45_24485 [Roseicella sp. DB1501]|uniref:Uncharacterized protein n=1 Tax=Roseicella aquatilis TaxID=2527868 RepID=A0A4R4D715_9PROT|nr:hypothetical protein [Roseicella sp. DB1501]TCZ55819.1 hypothetical protein EXY23_20790 [Roseicella aquatilis]
MGTAGTDWLRALRVYLGTIAVTDLVWESAHLPLYTIWRSGTLREQLFAVIHCTAGDVLIALSCLTAALLSVGHRDWPLQAYGPVAIVTTMLGLGYTIFSEWLNIVVRQSWAYSELMPVVPVIHTGLSPLLQWLVVPLAAFWLARRTARHPPAVLVSVER